MKTLLIILAICLIPLPVAAQYRTFNGAINGQPYTGQTDRWGNTSTYSPGQPVIVVPQTPPGQYHRFQGSANGHPYTGQTDQWGNTQIYAPQLED